MIHAWQTPEQALAYYTECQLATLKGLRMKKRTPQSELARHQKIADGMVAHCKAFCTPTDLNRVSAVRLEKLLK